MQERTSYKIKVWGGATKTTFIATFIGLPTAEELVSTIKLLGPSQAAKSQPEDVERWSAIVRLSDFESMEWTSKNTQKRVEVAGTTVGYVDCDPHTVYEPLRSTSMPGPRIRPCTIHGPRCPHHRR